MAKMQPTFKTGGKPLSRSLRVYQKAAIVFVVVSFILLLVVLYLSLSSATIIVTPAPTLVSATVPIEVAAGGDVVGVVVQDTFNRARMFELPQEGATAVEGKAGGSVTLINETETAQQLVATTRLLSEEGVLFRLDDAVNIPANGQIEAIVHADKAGMTGDIGATQFTIPGLAPALQTVIYAVSVDSMIGGIAYVRVLSQADLDQAVAQLAQEMVDEGKPMLLEGVDLDAYDAQVFQSEVLEKVSDKQPGVETGSFTLSVTTRVTGVFYSSKDVATAAEGQLYQELQSGFEVTQVNKDGLQATVQSVDAGQGIATLSVYLDGTAMISTGADLLDKARLIGKSSADVISRLEASDAIDRVEVNLKPFWLSRVPKAKDHITITVLGSGSN